MFGVNLRNDLLLYNKLLIITKLLLKIINIHVYCSLLNSLKHTVIKIKKDFLIFILTYSMFRFFRDAREILKGYFVLTSSINWLALSAIDLRIKIGLFLGQNSS